MFSPTSCNVCNNHLFLYWTYEVHHLISQKQNPHNSGIGLDTELTQYLFVENAQIVISEIFFFVKTWPIIVVQLTESLRNECMKLDLPFEWK